MSTKTNIFSALPQHQSDDEDDQPKGEVNKKNANKGPRVRKGTPKTIILRAYTYYCLL